MKNKFLAPIILSLGFFVFLTPFLAFAQYIPEPVELKLELRDEITENQVKELLQDKDYLITNLKGEVQVGDETITDFISKGKGETLEDVDELFQEQRQTLLVNMLQTQELSEEKSEEMKQQFNREELLTTIRETKNTPAKVKEISVITENQEKAQAIKDSLQNRSEIKDIRESIKEIQAEQKEVKEENQALKWLRSTLNFFFAPLRAVANSTPAWVPDFTSIAFFDTDEVGLNPYEDWVSFDSSGSEVTDIESHWWDTYVVADTGPSGGNDVIGNFTNDNGTGWTGWRNLPQHQGTPNDTQDHELVSVGNTLYNFYRTKSTFDVASMLTQQTCLFKYFDGNGQYNAWNWTPWQKQEKDLPGNSRIETTSDTTRLTQVADVWGGDNMIRTLEYQSNPGRGYISYVRWDEKPYSNYFDAYEHDVKIKTQDDQGNYIGSYLDDTNSPVGCYPEYRYTATNLPYSYIDTRLDVEVAVQPLPCDTASGEPSWSLGIAKADEILEDKYYYIYVQTDRGSTANNEAPRFIVRGQDSVRTSLDPEACRQIYLGPTAVPIGTEWCVFGKDFGPQNIPDAHLIFDEYGGGLNRTGSYPYWYVEN